MGLFDQSMVMPVSVGMQTSIKSGCCNNRQGQYPPYPMGALPVVANREIGVASELKVFNHYPSLTSRITSYSVIFVLMEVRVKGEGGILQWKRHFYVIFLRPTRMTCLYAIGYIMSLRKQRGYSWLLS